MFDTTHVPLAQAAEILGADLQALLIAAAEGRIRLYGLVNQVLRASKYEVEDISEPPWHVSLLMNQTRKRFYFVPLEPHSCAELLRTGSTGEIRTLSEIESDGLAWQFDQYDDEKPPCLEIHHIFASRAEVNAFNNARSVPQAGTIATKAESNTINGKSNKLVFLNQAANKFWGNVEKADPTTQPSNADVAAWLEEQGLSASQAKHAASIIRPEWAHTGRKPGE